MEYSEFLKARENRQLPYGYVEALSMRKALELYLETLQEGDERRLVQFLCWELKDKCG